jgi:gliding motility-associated-like protein
MGEFASLHDSGGSKYTWIPSEGLNNAFTADPLASPPNSIKYMAIAKLGSCLPDTNYVTVIMYPLPTVDAGPDQRLLAGSVAKLKATGNLIAQYLWTPGATLNCDTCYDPQASMSVTTTYVVKVATEHGCLNSDSVTIHLYCDNSQLFVPNSFTPNGDGENDVFYPRGKGVSEIKSFRIYNRWGEKMFERSGINLNDASNAWDGSYNGADPRPDVYVWVIDALCETGEPLFLKGDITIIR